MYAQLTPFSFSIAPMMGWTDRHCRYFHRQFSSRVLLYTEMITANALVYGQPKRHLCYNLGEHPLAVQLGGGDPTTLYRAAQIVCDYGYSEINLNVGCPSNRVQAGCFGAALMAHPNQAMRCLNALQKASTGAVISIKCRIGIDTQNPYETLPYFLSMISKIGVKKVIIHARKAWLQGLSPKENRTLPSLDYQIVRDMKKTYPDLNIVINGGLTNVLDAYAFLADGLDGVMIGRAAYQKPCAILPMIDHLLAQDKLALSTLSFTIEQRLNVAYKMQSYIHRHFNQGNSIHHITRHMFGLFAGQCKSNAWRQALSKINTNSSAKDFDRTLAIMTQQ